MSETIRPVSLLTVPGLHRILTEMVTNFTGFAPLGTVLVSLLGIGIAERSGLIGTVLRLLVLSAMINLAMGSASAKWAIMAPVFIPMFMLLGYSPELAQTTYRVGDSVTNVISPLMSYLPLVIAFMKRYRPDAGIGTVVATMLPYSVVFFLAWTAMLIVSFLLGIPVGPGAPLKLPVG